jgi:hypothetical protein
MPGISADHRHRVACLLASLCVVLAAGAGGARAAGIPLLTSKALPGPSTLVTGFVDNWDFESPSAAVRSQWLGKAQQLGSAMVRLDVSWASIAPGQPALGFDPADPADPGYDWTALDADVRSAAAAGQTIVLMVYVAPAWAEGPDPPGYVAFGAWEPQPAPYGAFAQALATRYSGHFPDPLNPGSFLPRVEYFQAWNEPNLPDYLMPQWVTGPKRTIVAESPIIYRALLNAFYAGVKAAQPSAVVLTGGTAPYGDAPGVDRMKPLVFLRGLLCMTAALKPARCADPAHFDALDHHPYALTPTLPAAIPGDVSVPDMVEIAQLLRAAERAGHALPAGPKPIWVTELDWSTLPDVPKPVSLPEQAAYLSRAFYLLWRQGIGHVLWFDIQDPPGGYSSAAGGGLYQQDGAAKPSVTAFAFPFVALDDRDHRRTIWGRAPRPGIVVIERRTALGWRAVLRLRTTAGGVFFAVHQAAGSHVALRAQQGSAVSLGWS